MGDFSGELRMMMVAFGLVFRVGVGLPEGATDLGDDDKVVLLDNGDASEGGVEAVARTCNLWCRDKRIADAWVEKKIQCITYV